MTVPPEALERAYRQTLYRILVDGAPIERRIGQADPDADERLRREAGCRRCWALVTAWNPGSLPCDESLNRQWQARLQQRLAQLGQPHFPALHRSPAGDWPDEESFLLIDPPPGRAAALGQAFGQVAVVTATLGEAPQLVWLQSDRTPAQPRAGRRP